DVRRLQERISKEPVGVQVFVRQLRLLVLIGRHTLQPAQWRDHGKQDMQLSVLLHMRLHKHGATLRIQSRSHPIQDDLNRVIAHARSVVVIGRQRVPVGNKEKTGMGVLQLYPVLQRAHIVAKVQFPRRAHTAEHARPVLLKLVSHGWYWKFFLMLSREKSGYFASLAAPVGCGAIDFTFTGLAGIPTEIVYGGTSFVATPIDPSKPCSCTRTPLITVA